MRKPPGSPPPEVRADLSRRRVGRDFVDLVTQRRKYRVITPLFGGGVEPEMADPVTTVRGPEIRGQLRFWWRACKGGGFNGDLGQMKEMEDEIWGAASTPRRPLPSKVQVQVEIDSEGRDEQPFQSPRWRKLSYAAFPLRQEKRGVVTNPPGSVRSNVCFTLTITFPKQYQEHVEAALWAWETFGGIGARTRRGFGALQLVSVDGMGRELPEGSRVEDSIRSGLRKHVATGAWPAGVPHLSHNVRLKLVGPFSDPWNAWEYLIQKLREFRQSRYPGSPPSRPGRSQWPEPDTIRNLTGMSSSKHARPLSLVRKFPRGQFGLPIVFHFKDPGDPRGTRLEGEEHDRLASPLILRPLACREGAVGLALILEGTGVNVMPGGLVLKHDSREYHVAATLTPAEAKSIPPLGGKADVLEAFLGTL